MGRPAVSGKDNILKLVDAAPVNTGYRLQDQIGFILRKAHQRHVALFASTISDLTPPQFATLAMLAEAGETSQNQLGQMVAMDAATAKGVVDRLRSRGYVTVAKDSGDKRRVLVALTAEGRVAYEKLVPLARDITQSTLAPLNERDATALVRLLGKIG